jgi:hypothetical protein
MYRDFAIVRKLYHRKQLFPITYEQFDSEKKCSEEDKKEGMREVIEAEDEIDHCEGGDEYAMLFTLKKIGRY